MNNILEICTDASTRKFPNGRVFGCAGALCITTLEQDYLISQDTTNNRSELLGIYLGLKLGKRIMGEHPEYSSMIIYSDSQFAVFGLTRWMQGWMKTKDQNGIIYGSNGKPVKNQELFMCILSYITSNQLKVSFRHCSAHVRYTSVKMLKLANEAYYKSNGEYLRPEDVYKLAYYNDIVDNSTREYLQRINPDMYPKMDYSNNYNIMTKYIVPNNYTKFIGE
jgi:ribonuclease HI